MPWSSPAARPAASPPGLPPIRPLPRPSIAWRAATFERALRSCARPATPFWPRTSRAGPRQCVSMASRVRGAHACRRPLDRMRAARHYERAAHAVISHAVKSANVRHSPVKHCRHLLLKTRVESGVLAGSESVGSDPHRGATATGGRLDGGGIAGAPRPRGRLDRHAAHHVRVVCASTHPAHFRSRSMHVPATLLDTSTAGRWSTSPFKLTARSVHGGTLPGGAAHHVCADQRTGRNGAGFGRDTAPRGRPRSPHRAVRETSRPLTCALFH